ncbi:MAG: glutamate mutase L, partial [Desulfobulbaceae bacterium]|nr:glutamate mutase L [Desulfobulbaceae bacterium]
LSSSDIREIENTKPDVILLTGGTDGGNEDYPLHNARKLAKSSLKCPIIYAGNRAAEDELAEILHKKTFTITENVLPSIDRPNTIPAKEAIRDVFLREIVKGKGLDEVMERAGEPPRPTPLAMLEFVQLVAEIQPDFGDFCLIDMGGATTDFYSTNKAVVTDSVLFKGLPEPHYKRSVEADLGMRVTAQSALVSADSLIRKMVETEGFSYDEFKAFVDRISESTSYLPIDKKEKRFDSILATACFALAVIRHAGVQERIFIMDGERLVQTGKDLREIKKIIGTGGYLSKFGEDFFRKGFTLTKDKGQRRLVPRKYTYYRDEDYHWPVLANASLIFPEAAVEAAIKGLKKT